MVLLVGEINGRDLLRALNNGVRGVLRRDAQRSEILAALEDVAAGLSVLGADQLEVLIPIKLGDEELGFIAPSALVEIPETFVRRVTPWQ